MQRYMTIRVPPAIYVQAVTMAVRTATNKVHNKKLRRRREGLSTKCYEYGELDGVELALFVRYPQRGEFYSYMSSQHLSWVQEIHKMVCMVSDNKQSY
jgi:hypothetical protein